MADQYSRIERNRKHLKAVRGMSLASSSWAPQQHNSSAISLVQQKTGATHAPPTSAPSRASNLNMVDLQDYSDLAPAAVTDMPVQPKNGSNTVVSEAALLLATSKENLSLGKKIARQVCELERQIQAFERRLKEQENRMSAIVQERAKPAVKSPRSPRRSTAQPVASSSNGVVSKESLTREGLQILIDEGIKSIGDLDNLVSQYITEIGNMQKRMAELESNTNATTNVNIALDSIRSRLAAMESTREEDAEFRHVLNRLELKLVQESMNVEQIRSDMCMLKLDLSSGSFAVPPQLDGILTQTPSLTASTIHNGELSILRQSAVPPSSPNTPTLGSFRFVIDDDEKQLKFKLEFFNADGEWETASCLASVPMNQLVKQLPQNPQEEGTSAAKETRKFDVDAEVKKVDTDEVTNNLIQSLQLASSQVATSCQEKPMVEGDTPMPDNSEYSQSIPK